ncbi:acyl-CoA thioesterase [Fastidiosibacter lacustris]|uniref:acyl-CoA thioesterase n=1 Tax=Fastidiosibacter lacustris TaxID=2056695 RepID=UPI001865308F|nr:thioesterase family protein [Fastidiosibacter lacustris]
MISSKTISHLTEIRVPFYDIDSLHIAWHGHYVKYFEVARCELLNEIGYNYNDMAASGYMWPIVDLQIKYIRPAVFGQTIQVVSSIIEYQNRLKIAYLIVDKSSQQKLTKGHTTQLAIDLKTQQLQFVSPLCLIEKIKSF